ncbi:glycine--tRNA ligase [Candidatus Woesearchaeota archaeon]|nr:glycine--tRNA ligase [Candidatus Woesearchaeota archaeon]
MSKPSIQEIAAFCKRKGIIYPTAEIYGGLAGFYDYGPYGIEIKNNLKKEWWKFHVHKREDIVGIDGSIITNPEVWKASGHVDEFHDPLITCGCGYRERADIFIEENLGIKAEGLSIEEMKKVLEEKNAKCPRCNKPLRDIKLFGLMFTTNIGPVISEKNKAYLRPETAQLIFADFPLIVHSSRLEPPFGIAQIGKAFRNEISPRNFLFRMREFEQMEIEYFVKPWQEEECPYIEEVMDKEIKILTIEMQKNNEKEKKMKVKEIVKKKIMNPWHAYWISKHIEFFESIGINPENLRVRQHLKEERAHYAIDTWDLEYKFPFGWKELEGFANRTDYDLKRHQEYSKKKLELVDQEKGKYIPYVIAEPSLGVDRAILMLLYEAYNYDEKRGYVVLKLHPRIAPIKAAVFPLIKKDKEQVRIARQIYQELVDNDIVAFYDETGSIGRRYARQDEIGTPWCITIDHQTLQDETVTIRHRDTQKQERIHKSKIVGWIKKNL